MTTAYTVLAKHHMIKTKWFTMSATKHFLYNTKQWQSVCYTKKNHFRYSKYRKCTLFLYLLSPM